MLTWWYRRSGSRYPYQALASVLHLEDLVFLFGVGVLTLYVPMSLGKFALLVAVAMAAQEAYALLTLRYFRRQLVPLVAWEDGGREVGGAADAWRVAASVPYELLRLYWRRGYPVLANLAWALVATWALRLEAWAIPIMLAASLVLSAYGNGLSFFVMERAMQPVLDDLASHLNEEAQVQAISMPLGRRLLAALPTINLATGVAAVGLVGNGHAGVGTLGLAIGASLAVALTMALAFSVLLTTSVLAPIRRLQAGTTRVTVGDLATRVPVSASDETGSLTHSFNRMVGGLQERERLRDAFGTFVDPELAERVAREGTDLRGEELELSILFMDVRGFTAFSERAPAPEVVARLNALYELVVPIILHHGGHANKFIGDGLLAVFGAPERHADHADRAVAAAIQIASDIGKRYRGELRVGLGVNSGSAVVGTIGGGGRLDFTVIGDAVNTASRVESATRETGDDLLITQQTRRLLTRPHANWDERPPVALKGKSDAIRLFAPTAVVPDGHETPRPGG